MEKQTKKAPKSKKESKKKKKILLGLFALVCSVIGFMASPMSFFADTITTLQGLQSLLPKNNIFATVTLTPTMTSISNTPTIPVKLGYPSVPDSGAGCPRFSPDNPELPVVDIMVRYWCGQEVYDQHGNIAAWQYTLRPRIVNNTSSNISVSIKGVSAIRLLVGLRYFDKEGNKTDIETNLLKNWKPISTVYNRTEKNGDKPFLISCDNQQFWAVPPDQVEDYFAVAPIAIDSVGRILQGFSTKWYIDNLDPNSTLFYDVKTDNGVLSFHVPDKNVPVYGLAVIDTETNDILGIAHRASSKEWGESSRIGASEFW